MSNLGLSLVALSQGVPFFHAGDDLLRSKSMDRDSYDSGDWFNRLDFSYTTNNWGVGLPIADKNQDLWPLMQPLLADPALKPGEDDILASAMHLREMLQIRKSSPLFRLRTAEEVQACVWFWNTSQTPGLIAMVLDDTLKRDANYQMMVLVFNALPETQTVEADDLSGINFELHPVQVDSRDDVVKNAVYDAETNTFSVPGRTTAVFVARD
jgi:pullulanase/glycogen debranching enzyme